MKLSQRAEDWLTLLGLVAIGLIVNVLFGTAVLYAFELLGLSPVGEAAAVDTLRAIRGARAGPPIDLASPGSASMPVPRLDDCLTAA